MARLTSAALRSGEAAAEPRLGLRGIGRRDVAGLEARWVMASVSRRKVTLERCASTSDWLASTLV